MWRLHSAFFRLDSQVSCNKNYTAIILSDQHHGPLPAAIPTRISTTVETATIYTIHEPTGSDKRYCSHKSYPVI